MQTTKLLHYRNGVYQGQVKSNKRNGKGILITDKGQIIVGTWKNDKPYGNALTFLNNLQYSYGQFNRGQLQGWSKFESLDKILVSQFNSNHPIGKQILIDKNQSTYQITIPARNAIYQSVKQSTLSQPFNKSSLQELVSGQFNAKLPQFIHLSLNQILTECYKNDGYFQTQVLMNGYLMFKIKNQSSVIELGFVVNKNNQLVSYGSYANSKLYGCGCKFQNSIRYEGIFENGFLNGQGLKFNAGKFSFGTFQNGTLVYPVYLEERSLASQQKLKQLKKLNHIINLNFSNVYLPQNLLSFKGFKEIVFEVALKQEYIFAQSAQRNITPKKQNNLASKLLNRQQNETKSNYQLSSLKMNKNPQQNQSRISDIGKSVSGVNSQRRFKI